MWRRRPTGASWRMATPSSAARMVLPVLTVSLAANSLRHAVTTDSVLSSHTVLQQHS